MKSSRVINFISIGVVGIVIIIFLIKVIIDIPYKKQIPKIKDPGSFSLPVQEQLRGATNIALHHPTSDNIGMLGMVYHSIAQYDMASICYKLAIKKNKNKWLWSYYLAYLNLELGESNTAINNFRQVTRENPKMFMAWYYIAKGLQSEGKYDQAEAIYKKISNENVLNLSEEKKTANDFFPLSTYAKFQLARIYMESKHLEQAEQVLNDIIKLNRTFGPAYRLLGNLYRIKGDSILRKEFAVRANDLMDNSVPLDKLMDGIALLSRSDQFLLKQIDEAEKKAHPEFALVLVDRALNYMPENKYIISRKVKLMLHMNNGKQILPYLIQHLKNFSDDFIEIKEVANLLYNAGFYEQSNRYYTRAAELRPGDTEVQSSLVLCLWKAGLRAKALEKMDNLVVIDKGNIKILASGVYIMLVIGEKEKTLSYLAKLRQLAPSNPRVQLMSGMVAEMNGNILTAISLYELSFKGNPRDLATIQAMANALTKQKMWRKLINHYRLALDYFPNEPYLLEKLGSQLISCVDTGMRNIDEGMKFSERAFIHKASTADITISSGKSLAMAYAAKGDYNTARTYMEWILNMARNQKVPAVYVQELENQLKHYSAH